MIHRPAPDANHATQPMRSWVWSQHWLDLLFLHWTVPADALRPHVPGPIEIDTHDGDAWVSLILFRLRVRPRWLPFLPGVSNLVEVNLRTYVRSGDRSAIWFLSVHADNRWAIRLGRLLTAMPYQYAPMSYRQAEGRFAFRAGDGCESAFSFRPTGATNEAPVASLDEWLLERYRLFARGRGHALVQAEVSHPRWLIQSAEVSLSANRLWEAHGLDLARSPDVAHYSPGVAARFGAFRALEGTAAGRREMQVTRAAAANRP